MSHAITLSDEQYETLKAAAAARSLTPDELLAAAIATLSDQRDPLKEPRYYDTDAWFRHLEGGDFVENESADADA